MPATAPYGGPSRVHCAGGAENTSRQGENAVLAICAAAPASAQPAPTLVQQVTSPDGFLTLSLFSANASDAVNVNHTYTWVVTNNSPTSP